MDNQEHILVTGGAGMIGSNLVKRLVSMRHRVSVVDNLWRGRKEYLKHEGNYVIDMDKDFHLLDLTRPEALDPLLDGVSYVYHLAEIVAGVGYVFCNQGDVFHKNMLINTNVIASVRSRPLKGYVYVGTACSFPADKQTGVEAPPLKEADQYPASPESAYGWSKLMGEYETFLMEEETDIPVSVLVLHNVYGTPCDYSDERGQVIPSLVRKAVRYPEEAFNIWGSGSQGRAFVHVNDVVDALVDTLTRGLGQGVIQIGPDVCTTIREIAELIVSISGKSIDIHYDTSKPEGDRGRCADYTKAKNILGWQPRTELRDGLSELYAWIDGINSRDQ
jgi:nucleoside-diphosphate-sugar epimerase